VEIAGSCMILMVAVLDTGRITENPIMTLINQKIGAS
jgi:hypothetical protein